jgi:excisionase family DNA binding protein
LTITYETLALDGPPLTTAEVAPLLRRTPRSIRRMIARGDIPALLIGGGHARQFLIPREALRRYLADHRAEATTS